jgi:hypothetical protein
MGKAYPETKRKCDAAWRARRKEYALTHGVCYQCMQPLPEGHLPLKCKRCQDMNAKHVAAWRARQAR